MRIVLVIEQDSSTRRQVAEALLGAGYGVCETFSCELVPAVPRLDAVVCPEGTHGERFGAPIVAIPRPLDPDVLLASVRAAVTPEQHAA